MLASMSPDLDLGQWQGSCFQQLPPHALNVFLPLVDLNHELGSTFFYAVLRLGARPPMWTGVAMRAPWFLRRCGPDPLCAPPEPTSVCKSVDGIDAWMDSVHGRAHTL